MNEEAGFGLYVHWPFCAAKCPYCDFNSHVVANVDQSRWRDGLISEIHRYASQTSGKFLKSIFFGGGTPSLMNPSIVEDVIYAALSSWQCANDIEITLEANPSSIDAKRFEEYAKAGVNRISVGVQSLRDPDLKLLGRLHSAGEAVHAVKLAKTIFPRVSFDMIYARQNQTLSGWRQELEEALQLEPDHLSLYQLTIEEGTAFGERHAVGKLKGLPDDELGADMYESTREQTHAAGLDAYEVSNHAKPGEECRHNLVYWKSGDWIGVGPGAHGRLTLSEGRFSTICHHAPGQWLNGVEQNSSGERERSLLSQTDQLEEFLLMGLRLREGVPIRFIPKELYNKINEMVDIGLLEEANQMLRATKQGQLVLNYVLRRILA